jgi:hypothetical protein
MREREQAHVYVYVGAHMLNKGTVVVAFLVPVFTRTRHTAGNNTGTSVDFGGFSPFFISLFTFLAFLLGARGVSAAKLL